jgi:predicted metal-dependent RNase
VTDSFGTKGWWQKLVRNSPLGSVCVSEENTSGLLLQRVERMSLVDLFGEEVGFRKYYCSERWIVGMVGCASEVRRLDYRSVLFEESLVVAKVIWVYLEEISDKR